MDEGNYQLVFYTTESGKSPVREFLASLPLKLRNKADHDLHVLREKATTLREPFSKPVANGVFELRIRQGTDAVRVFYFFYEWRTIVVTNGFVKKSRKAPRKEIEKAFRYKTDWEKRQKHGRP